MHERVRVVFLLDVSSATSADVQSYHKSLCLQCTKVLLSLSVFPSRVCVKWMFLPINVDESVVGRVPPFVDVTLDSIRTLFEKLKFELLKNADRQVKPLPATALSSTLATVVQCCLWDSPNIYSPPRRQKRSRVSNPLNIIVVCSGLPGRFQQVLSNDLQACLLKHNVHMICLKEESFKEKDMEDVILPFIEPIPSPASLIFCHQTEFAKEQIDGNTNLLSLFTQPANIGLQCGNPEVFWLYSNVDGGPLCAIHVDPVLKSGCHCSILSSIHSCNLSVEECKTHQDKANYAVIVGVIREHDVNSSFLPMSHSSFTCTGLCAQSLCSDTSGSLQQNGLESLKGSKLFSQEFQHLCIQLASNKLCLLLKVETNGETGLCILQPLWSVMSLLTMLKPQSTTKLASTLSTVNTLDMTNKFQLQSNCITYPELYYKLVPPPDCIKVPESDIIPDPEELEEEVKVANFSFNSLLPWYPYSEGHGISTTHFQRIKRLQNSVKTTRIAEVISEQLMKIAPLKCKENAEDKKAHTAKTDDDSLDKCVDFIAAGYAENIKSCSESLQLQEWVADNLCKLHVEGVSLLTNVCKFLLLSTERLEQKYAKGLHNNDEKLTEYLLQVLLRLEVNHISVQEFKDQDINTLATEVTHLLRKISLMAKPSFLGQLMKEVILPNYSATCQIMLLHVYERLLLPMPIELGGSCLGSPEKEDAREDSVSSDDDERSVGQLSVDNVSSAPVKSVAVHSFMRHASFQDQRQIIMPTQKPKVKKGEGKDSKDTCRKTDLSPGGNHSKGSTEQTSEQVPRSVCRTLFKRSMSLNVDIGCKRQRDEDHISAAAKRNKVDVVVKETPIKKQVENYRRYKLQRLRSKMYATDAKAVDVVGESPRRSFYSSSMSSRPSSSHMKELLEGKIAQGKTTQYTAKTCVASYDNENPLTEEINHVAESPSSSASPSTPDNSTLPHTTLRSDDPYVFGDSASMVAFALSTPTKDDKLNFKNAL